MGSKTRTKRTLIVVVFVVHVHLTQLAKMWLVKIF